MLWFLLSLISAFTLATTDVISKKIIKHIDNYVLIWIRTLAALPFILVLLFFTKIPELDKVFWLIVLITLPLGIIAIILYIRAIEISPLSLTIPFLALTPVFLIATSFFILNELPTYIGIIGIFLIAVGAYTLHIDDAKKDILLPIKDIFKEKGSVLMIVVAFIFSINANLVKILILHSNPIFFGAFFYLALSAAFFFIVLIKSRNKIKQILKFKKELIAIGFFNATSAIAGWFAIIMVIVPYMIAVKRTSVLFSVLYGYFIFREKNIKEHLLGSVLMVAGVILIILCTRRC